MHRIYRGYQGMIEGDQGNGTRSVNIVNKGTVLKSARSLEFRTPEGRKRLMNILKAGIDALVVIEETEHLLEV
jgi:6-phosphofructokinase 1